jgi:hypothetical protein
MQNKKDTWIPYEEYLFSKTFMDYKEGAILAIGIRNITPEIAREINDTAVQKAREALEQYRKSKKEDDK